MVFTSKIPKSVQKTQLILEQFARIFDNNNRFKGNNEDNVVLRRVLTEKIYFDLSIYAKPMAQQLNFWQNYRKIEQKFPKIRTKNHRYNCNVNKSLNLDNCLETKLKKNFFYSIFYAVRDF